MRRKEFVSIFDQIKRNIGYLESRVNLLEVQYKTDNNNINSLETHIKYIGRKLDINNKEFLMDKMELKKELIKHINNDGEVLWNLSKKEMEIIKESINNFFNPEVRKTVLNLPPEIKKN